MSHRWQQRLNPRPNHLVSSAFRAGNDPTNAARYHPLYITDSPEGGFGQKSEEEQRQQKIYAGVTFDQDQFPIPTAGTISI